MTDNKITTVIIDDEPDAINLLKELLTDFPEIDVMATAGDASSAYKAILEHEPDLIFLDIQMPGESGIALTERFRTLQRPPCIILVTAHNQYAISAIKHAAFDYILKPVARDELKEAIARFKKKRRDDSISEKLDELHKTIINHQKIRFNTRTGFFLIKPSEIVFCQAEGSYTQINISNGEKELVTINLGRIEKLLPEPYFYRLSRFHIINLNYVSRIDRKERICELDDHNSKYELPIPKKHIKELEYKLNILSKG